MMDMQVTTAEAPRKRAADAATQQAPVTLHALARKHMKDADGDVKAAAEAMASELRMNAGLLKQVIVAALKEAAMVSVAKVHHEMRSAIVDSAMRGREAVEAGARAEARSLLDFPLPGGLRLRDATFAQVKEAAGVYREQADTMSVRARWLESIAVLGRPNKIVGNALTDAQVSGLYAEASNV